MRARITTEASFLDLVDILSRGSTAEWRELYERAKSDAGLREDIRDALRFVDPDMGASRELWSLLLSRIERTQKVAPQSRRMA